MKPKIYIDGQEGTTGLQIYDRLEKRSDLELLHIDSAKRKDTGERKKLINSADIVLLCLPDDAAREAVAFVENRTTRVIDASTAHRTAPGWVYGYPELTKDHREKNQSRRPRCQPRLPCARFYFACLSSRHARHPAEGLPADLLFSHRILRRRKKDDRVI